MRARLDRPNRGVLAPPRRRAPVYRYLALATTLALTLTGCLAPPNPDPAPDPTFTPAVSATGPIGAIRQTDRTAVKPGGHLRIGLSAWATDWNPWSPNATEHTRLVTDTFLPRLFDIAPSGALSPNPNYLADPPLVSHREVTEVIYHLNPAARWGDGRPLDWTDFDATWRVCRSTPADPSPPGTTDDLAWYDKLAGFPAHCADAAALSAITTIAPGDSSHDVVVTYGGVFTAWAHSFSHGLLNATTVPEAGNTSPAYPRWEDLAGHPEWSAGPYVVTAQSSHAITLIPNARWWGDPVLLASLTFTYAEPTVLAEDYALGRLDAWPVGLEATAFRAAIGVSQGQIRRATATGRRYLLVTTTGLAADRRIRQAILQGLDRVLVGQAALPGLDWAPPAPTTLTGQMATTSLAQATGLGFDLAQANSRLDQAGWVQGVDQLRRQDDNATLELTFAVGPSALAEAEGLQIARQLAALGIRVRLVYPAPIVPEPGSVGAETPPGANPSPGADLGADWDLTTVTWLAGLPPAWELRDHFRSTSRANLTGYANAAVDGILDTAVVSVDVTTRADLVEAVSQLLWRDAVAIPLYDLPDTWAVTPTLANFGPTGLATLRWEDVGFV